MIEFSPLRTKRLALKLRELSIVDSISLATVPPDRHEAATSEFLARIIENANAPTPLHVVDPRAWTVQERSFVVGHYLAHVGQSGANFEVGDGHYADYLDPTQDFDPSPQTLGDVAGDIWSLIPLTGAAAEAIESLRGEVENVSGRFHWLLGAMAAQLRQASDAGAPDPLSDSGYSAWLKARMLVFARYPESDFIRLLDLYFFGVENNKHFFSIDFDEEGVILLPKEAGAALSPARFPVDTCISDFAKGMVGKPQ